jgi:hypothetical protein
MDVRSMNQKELDIWMEQMNAQMDEISLLAPPEEMENLSEIPDQGFPIGGR